MQHIDDAPLTSNDDRDLVLIKQGVEVLHPVHVEGAVKDKQMLAIIWAGGKFPGQFFIHCVCNSLDVTVKPEAARDKTILPSSV